MQLSKKVIQSWYAIMCYLGIKSIDNRFTFCATSVLRSSFYSCQMTIFCDLVRCDLKCPVKSALFRFRK
jgi:hypothetical protein